MTDEEKAEEYANKKLNKLVYCSCCQNPDVKQAYLDGLVEGKPKWHEIENHVKPSREIAKKYMPKGNQKVMLKYHFYNDEEIHYSDGYYNVYDFEFHIPNNPTSRIICVIAWCCSAQSELGLFCKS